MQPEGSRPWGADVSERAIRAALAPFHLVVDVADGRLVEISPAARHWYGIEGPSGSAGGPNVLGELERGGPRTAGETLARLQGTGPVELRLEHRTMGGEPRDATALARPIGAGSTRPEAGSVPSTVGEAAARGVTGRGRGGRRGSSGPAPDSLWALVFTPIDGPLGQEVHIGPDTGAGPDAGADPDARGGPDVAGNPDVRAAPDIAATPDVPAAPDDPNEPDRRRAVAALAEVAESVVTLAPLGIAVADLDGRLVAVNPAMAAITGYPEAELIGLDYRLLTHPDDRGQTDEERRRLWGGDADLYRMEKRYLRRDGSVAVVEVASTLLHDPHGRPWRQLGFVLDVTEHRELAAATTRFVAAVEGASDGVLTLDGDHRCTFANAEAARLLAVPVERLIGGRFWETVPGLADTPLATQLAKAGRGQPTGRRLVPNEAAERWLETSVFPSPLGLVVFLRDATERVSRDAERELALRSQQATLSHLEDVDRARTAFLSAVSHELRTPLAVILGMAETLVVRRSSLDERRRDQVERALHEQAQRLASLLDDLLHVDQLSRRAVAVRRSHFDLPAAVHGAVAASQRPGRVRIAGPVRLEVFLDRIQVERILSNLLANADKYAVDGRVDVEVAPLASGGARLRVCDQGPGVPPEERERIFAPYVRIDESHPAPGTGVGLALVAEFASLHGGWARVTEAAGGGACFEVVLPGADGARSETTPTHPESSR